MKYLFTPIPFDFPLISSDSSLCASMKVKQQKVMMG